MKWVSKHRLARCTESSTKLNNRGPYKLICLTELSQWIDEGLPHSESGKRGTSFIDSSPQSAIKWRASILYLRRLEMMQSSRPRRGLVITYLRYAIMAESNVHSQASGYNSNIVEMSKPSLRHPPILHRQFDC